MTTPDRKRPCYVLAALLALALPASAQVAAPSPAEAAFAAMDGNGDGQISPDEHASAAEAAFDAMDADHNYSVTAA